MKSFFGFLIAVLISNASAQMLSVPGLALEGTTLQACASYTTLPAQDVTVTVGTREMPNNAQIELDFERVEMDFTFGPGSEMQQCVDIMVLDDNALENFEQFIVFLSINGVDVQTMTPLIQDTDTSVEVGFVQAAYSFNENDANPMVCVEPQNGGAVETLGGVTITVTTADQSAVGGGVDYDSVGVNSQSVTITSSTGPEGECFPVVIINDELAEADETFTITLIPGSDTTLAQGTTTVTIISDDECPALSSPANGMVSLSSSVAGQGTEATYSCLVGYSLVPSDGGTRTCQNDNTWSGQEPTCAAMCPDLPAPLNGMVDQPSNLEGGVATYTCDDGFTLIASSGETRTCLSDRTWSGQAPFCTRINVGPTGGLTQEQVTGIAVGASIGAVVIIVVIVLVVIVACYCVIRSRRNEKYTLNYSTTYGEQRKATDPFSNTYEGVEQNPTADNGENIELTEKA